MDESQNCLGPWHPARFSSRNTVSNSEGLSNGYHRITYIVSVNISKWLSAMGGCIVQQGYFECLEWWKKNIFGWQPPPQRNVETCCTLLHVWRVVLGFAMFYFVYLLHGSFTILGRVDSGNCRFSLKATPASRVSNAEDLHRTRCAWFLFPTSCSGPWLSDRGASA